VSKKLEQKQARRREQERKQSEQRSAARRTNLITLAIAVVVILVVVFAIRSERETTEAPVGVPVAEAGCDTVEEFEAQEGEHIREGSAHEPYNSEPPTSGPHFEIPADPAFYSSPVEPERVVHNLEHGQIVIYYSPDLDDQQKDWVEEMVNDEPAATVATPYDGLPDGAALAVTAWLAGEGEESAGTGIVQTCEQVSQAAVNEFRGEYQGRSPEPLTPRFSG
jgi:hypothetical protein